MRWTSAEETGFERTSPVREVNRPGHDVMDFDTSDVYWSSAGENNSRNGNPSACYRNERVFASTLRDRRSY